LRLDGLDEPNATRAPGWMNALVWEVLVGNYVAKVAWEAAVTPVMYRIVNFLKRAESEDYYDRDTNFTPFSLDV
jgi:hypothetical protein